MLGPPRSRCLQTLSAEDPISSSQTAVSLLYAFTWWIGWGISVSLFPRGTSSFREGSTLIMHFPLYSPAPSFQYTFCKTNSTQRFSVSPKDFLWIYKLSKFNFSFILVFRVSSFQFGDYMNLCGSCIWTSTSNSTSVSGSTQNVYIPHLIDRAWICFLIIRFCSMFPLHFSRKWQYTFNITLMC